VAVNVGTLVARLVADTSGFVAGMGAAQGALQGSAANMKTVGKGMTMALTVPMAAAGIAAVKTGLDYERTFSMMQGLAGVAADEVGTFDQAVRNLAGETAVAPQELADALYFIASSGLSGAAALDALDASAKASAAGLGETEVIADAVTSAINAYGSEAITATDATDVLVAAVREGKAEADSIAGAMGRVIPIASEMGVSFDQVGGAVAAMTRLGLDANESVTALRGILSSLLQPSQQAERTLAMVGTSAADLREKLQSDGLLSVLMELKERFQGNTAAMAQAFPNVRALAGVLNLVGNNADEAQQVFDALTESTGATDDAFGQAASTSGFQMKQALVALQVALLDIGDVLVPVAAGVASFAAGVLGAFTGLPDGAQKTIIAFAGMATAVGPLLMVIPSLVAGFALVKTALSTLGTAIAAHPILALATLIGGAIVASRMFGNSQAEATADVAGLTQAMRDQGSSVEGLRQFLQGAIAENEGLTSALYDSGATLDDLATAAVRGGDSLAAFARQVMMGVDAAGLTAAELELLANAYTHLDGETGQLFQNQGDAVRGLTEVGEAMGMTESEARELAAGLASNLGPAREVNDAMAAAGDSVYAVGGAYTEARGAAQELDAVTGNLAGSTDGVADAVANVRSEVQSAAFEFNRFAGTSDHVGAMAAGGTAEFHGLAAAARDTAGGAAAAGSASSEAAGGVDDLGGAADEAAGTVEQLEAAFAGLNNSLSQSDAMIAAEQSLLDFAAATAEATSDGQLLREEQLDLAAGLNDVISALRDESAALNTNADGTVNAAGAQEHLRGRLQAIARTIPAELRPQWRFLTQDILRVPTRRTTRPEAPGIRTRIGDFADLRRGVLEVPPRRDINVTSNVRTTLTAFQQLPAAIQAAGNAADRHFNALRPPGSYAGGPVPGGRSEAVPMLLHGGEFVLSSDVVESIKRGTPTRGLPAVGTGAGAVAGGGGSGTTVVVNVMGSATARDGQAVVDALVRWSRSNGDLPIRVRS